MQNASCIAQSFAVRLLVSISAVVFAATGAKILLLSQVLREDAALMMPRAMLYAGIIVADGLMLAGIGVLLWKRYETAVRIPLSDIADRIRFMQSASAHIGQSDLTEDCQDVNALCVAATAMLRRLTVLKHQLFEAKQQIVAASSSAFSASKTQSNVLASHVLSSQEMGRAVRELVTTVQQINQNVSAVVKIANQTLQTTEQGQAAVLDVVKSMTDIQHSAQVSANTIMALNKQSTHITDVIKTIDQIIEDTKLIAFNATIEAARSKEDGKGFGVVALEIKRLAEEVFESTEDIKEVIQDIQGMSRALVLATEEEMKTVSHGMDLAQQAGVALQQIFDMVQLTTESAQRIATATQQQQGASEQVLHSVELANDAMTQFSQQSKQLAVITAELSIQAEGLGQIVSAFGSEANQGEGAQRNGGRTSDS